MTAFSHHVIVVQVLFKRACHQPWSSRHTFWHRILCFCKVVGFNSSSCPCCYSSALVIHPLSNCLYICLSELL